MDIQYTAEYTDTFGGEANYSWVRRATFEAPDTASSNVLVRRAKKALGLGGIFRLKYDCGDVIRYDESGVCACLFITWSV